MAGPAGISADAIKVFEGINGTLVGAAFLLVIVLLIIIYRSPVFWFFPILAVAFAEITARGIGWGLTEVGVTVNGQSSAILSVLVIGAGPTTRCCSSPATARSCDGTTTSTRPWRSRCGAPGRRSSRPA